MLGKLIKYELKATARTLVPLYCALLMFALINKLFIGNNTGANMDILGGIPAMLSVFAYGCTMAAVFILTFFVIVQRFYKNLLGDEGYLMNTLPVPTWMNISSKLGAAIIWSIVSGFVAFLSIMIMAFSPDIFRYFFTDFANDLALISSEMSIGIEITLMIVQIIIIMIVSMISGTLMLYLSIAIGHIFNKRKILASFGAFIGINMIVNTIMGVMQLNIFLPNDFSMGINSFIWVGILIESLLAVVFFIGCNYIMKNKLNLE